MLENLERPEMITYYIWWYPQSNAVPDTLNAVFCVPFFILSFFPLRKTHFTLPTGHCDNNMGGTATDTVSRPETLLQQRQKHTLMINSMGMSNMSRLMVHV